MLALAPGPRGPGADPVDLDPGRVEAVHRALATLNARWQALAPGSVLRLDWPAPPAARR